MGFLSKYKKTRIFNKYLHVRRTEIIAAQVSVTIKEDATSEFECIDHNIVESARETVEGVKNKRYRL